MVEGRDNDIEEIFVYLLNEGTDVWRPVKARKISQYVYQIIGIDDEHSDEQWEFTEGSLVDCVEKTLSGRFGEVEKCMVAVRRLEN